MIETATRATRLSAALPSEAASRPEWVPDELFPFESRFCELPGQRLHYVDEGEGETVVLVPGSPMWSFQFRRSIARLATRRRVVAVDLPGLGLSTAMLERGRAFRNAAEGLDRLFDLLELENFTLLAHATAGPPTLEAAVRRHRSIRGLVISNSFAWPLAGLPRLGVFVRIVSSRPFAWANVGLNLLPRITARAGRRTGRFSEAERGAILGPFASPATRRHLQNYLFGVRAETDWLAAVEQRLEVFEETPALLLYGRHDNGYAAGLAERWQRTLPDHTLVVLDEAGHFPPEDEPVAFDDALESWLDRLKH